MEFFSDPLFGIVPPGVFTHAFRAESTGSGEDGFIVIQSGNVVPNEFREKPTHPKFQALFAELGVWPADSEPTQATRLRFLQIATNPEWGKYPGVSYRSSDVVPVLFTSTTVEAPTHESYRLVCATAQNSSVVAHAETTDAGPARSLCVVLYDGHQRLQNPNDVQSHIYDSLFDSYLRQSHAFLNAHNPSAPQGAARAFI
jgi:hypothetical protein